jgi:hypothetical protein
VMDVDASISLDYSDRKENAAATWKRTFGFHSLLAQELDKVRSYRCRFWFLAGPDPHLFVHDAENRRPLRHWARSAER